jgi:hypothetical protein
LIAVVADGLASAGVTVRVAVGGLVRACTGVSVRAVVAVAVRVRVLCGLVAGAGEAV